VAVNMRTENPAPEALLASVEEVIYNPKYKERALVLEKEMATFDTMEIVVKHIEELATGKA
jgi:UDP:flavonoid glycosyltransferase YjiC (YdhE family)